jgi:CDP-glycerol glycerophosphotransferase
VPLISVVIPVRDVEDDLGECLDSVLADAGADIEVIAVDSGSADHSGELLARRASSEGRLRVLRPGPAGPGAARNAGAAAASGDYLWFVDADDVLPGGSLAAVARHVARARPDVTLIGYELLYPGGGTSPGPGTEALRQAPAGCVTIAQRPGLLNHTMTAWGKVIRREFLASLGAEFPPGIHEDVPVSSALLLGAARISVLDQVCYRYRRGRPGSFMVTPSAEHFDIFRSYRKVLDEAAKRHADGDPLITGPVMSVLFERAIWHYCAILGSRGRGAGLAGRGGLVPHGQRHRFFDMMHEDFAAYRPAGYQFPGGPRGAKLRLVERGAYRTYSVLEPVNRLRVRLRAARPVRPASPG